MGNLLGDALLTRRPLALATLVAPASIAGLRLDACEQRAWTDIDGAHGITDCNDGANAARREVAGKR
jgi:hypothetical protein